MARKMVADCGRKRYGGARRAVRQLEREDIASREGKCVTFCQIQQGSYLGFGKNK